MKILRAILEHVPRRRRRFWRYVSPERRGAGVLLLALSVTLVYGYWYLSNEGRVRRLARSYLQGLTGGPAEVDSAKFTLFGGIELRGVRMYLPGADAPFLQAPLAMLSHRPWGLFFQGRLHVTRIACPGSTVTLRWDHGTKRYDVEGLRTYSEWGGHPFRGPLPELVARGAELHLHEMSGELCIRQTRTKLNVSGVPRGASRYLITLEEDRSSSAAGAGTPVAADARAPFFGSFQVDLATGDIVSPFVGVDVDRVGENLWQEWGHLQKRYGIKGRVEAVGRWESKPRKGRLEATLKDISLELPPEEGGLRVEGVSGHISLDERGVTIRNIRGRLPQFGGARLSMDGNYVGYDANSPFRIDLNIAQAVLPHTVEAKGPLGRVLSHIRKEYQPRGHVDLQVSLERSGGTDDVKVSVTAAAQGLSVVEREFPYPVEDLRGEILFANRRLEIRKLTGRHGSAQIQIDGNAVNLGKKAMSDFRIQAWDVAFDEDLRDAMPESYRRVWDDLSPAGTGSAQVRVYADRPGDRQHVDVELRLEGKASMEYREFPYRLDNLSGSVTFGREQVRIRSVSSRAGRMNCTVDGNVVRAPSGGQDVDLTIRGRFPVDEKLARALGETGQTVFQALRPSGWAETVTARVHRKAGQELDYTVTAKLKDVSFQLDSFPYPVTGAAGTLIVTPGQVEIKDLAGWHDETRVTVNGRVYHGETGLGMDLHVKGENVSFDSDLAAAVPEPVKGIWRKLSPAGLADVEFRMQRNTPAQPGDTSWQVTIRPRKMHVAYSGFPFPMRWVGGEVVATAEGVEFRDVTAGDGKMEVCLNGRILLDEKARSEVRKGNLRLRAVNVAINEELIAALRKAEIPLLSRFHPGGTFSLDLQRLDFERRKPASTTRQASRPAPSAPVSRHPDWLWAIDGRIDVKDANFDMGVGRRTLSGSLSGSLRRWQAGLGVDADVVLDEISVGRRTITAVRGKVVKKPTGSLVKIEDLAGKFYGGQLDGFAEIRLGDPLRYGFRVTVDGVDLNELFNADVKDPKDRVKVDGKLVGSTIEVTATEGPKPDREAAGMLRITEAKLVKIPILLDVLNVIYLSVPQKWAFTDAYLTYHLRGDKLVFQEIYLVGGASSAVGSGTMNVKTEQLKLTFLVGPPGKLPRISRLAEEFLGGVLRELVEWRVTGTLKHPQRRPIPLRTLDAIIQRLLNPGK